MNEEKYIMEASLKIAKEVDSDPKNYAMAICLDIKDKLDTEEYRTIIEAIRLAKGKELLQECKLQLEYLNEKFGKTGTTNALLSKLNRTLKTTEP